MKSSRLRPHAADVSLRQSDGFTLIEMIITLVLLGLLAAVGTTIVSDSFTTTLLVNSSQASVAQARYTLERLEREIREIKYDGVANVYCISTMTTNKLVFYRTTRGAAEGSGCAANADIVNIDTSGTDLRLGNSATNGAGTPILTNHLGSLSLAYLDNNGCPTTSLGNSMGANCASPGGIRVVGITLTLTDSTSGQSISQTTRVALRNGS